MGAMLRKVGVVLLWLLATLGTASLTYAAVSSAGSAVGVDPSPPVAGADIAARISTTTSSTDAAAPPTSLPGTTAVPPSMPVSPTTIPTGATTTTVATTTASTTTSGAPTQHWKTVPGVGTVGVAVSGGSVTLVSATPVAPYQVDIEDDGPEKVEVEFDSDGADYKVRAMVRDGQLVWETESEGGGGGDDDDGEG